VLLEVLLSMTILSICGTVLMRTIMTTLEASKVARDVTKAIYLSKIKLHEFEMAYARKANYNLGEFRGDYTQEGASQFYWVANVEYNQEYDAFVITVQTLWGDQKRSRRPRRYSDSDAGVRLKSMVPTVRYNEVLESGGVPGKRPRGSRGRGGGSRGSRGSGRMGDRRF
jgi:Tfp pilus assembly protein PilV